jgi:hypothetical protein
MIEFAYMSNSNLPPEQTPEPTKLTKDEEIAALKAQVADQEVRLKTAQDDIKQLISWRHNRQ